MIINCLTYSRCCFVDNCRDQINRKCRVKFNLELKRSILSGAETSIFTQRYREAWQQVIGTVTVSTYKSNWRNNTQRRSFDCVLFIHFVQTTFTIKFIPIFSFDLHKFSAKRVFDESIRSITTKERKILGIFFAYFLMQIWYKIYRNVVFGWLITAQRRQSNNRRWNCFPYQSSWRDSVASVQHTRILHELGIVQQSHRSYIESLWHASNSRRLIWWRSEYLCVASLVFLVWSKIFVSF